jgi:hypothetical protein
MGNEVEASAQRVHDHLQRPDHPDRQLTNAKVGSTVNQTAPATRRSRVIRRVRMIRRTGRLKRARVSSAMGPLRPSVRGNVAASGRRPMARIRSSFATGKR